jgi:hypothetical protein
VDYLINFLQSSAEVKKWGANIETFFALSTVFFTFLQVRGAWKQRKNVEAKKSTKSVSESFFAFCTSYFFALIVYGLNGHKLAIIFNGLLLAPIYLLVLLKLLKYKRFNNEEFIVAIASALTIPLMIILENSGKEILFGALLIGLIFFGITMLVQMKQAGKRGAISLDFLLVTLATNIFWLFYAFTIRNAQLIVANSISIVTFLAMIFLYWKYGPEEIRV